MIPIQKQAYTETCLYIEREKSDPGLILNIFVMLLPPWVHEEVAAAFLLHLIVCQAKHQVHRFLLLLYTYIPRESRVQLTPISNQFLQLLYIQISNAFLRVWLPPLWPLTFVSLKDISVPGVTPSIPRSSPHRPLHKQCQPSHFLESPYPATPSQSTSQPSPQSPGPLLQMSLSAYFFLTLLFLSSSWYN